MGVTLFEKTLSPKREKRLAVLRLSRKLATMTRKFVPENYIFETQRHRDTNKGNRFISKYLVLSITFLMRQLQINRIHPFLYKKKF